MLTCGARLLPPVQERQGRLRQGRLERLQLGRRRRALRQGFGLSRQGFGLPPASAPGRSRAPGGPLRSGPPGELTRSTFRHVRSVGRVSPCRDCSTGQCMSRPGEVLPYARPGSLDPAARRFRRAVVKQKPCIRESADRRRLRLGFVPNDQRSPAANPTTCGFPHRRKSFDHSTPTSDRRPTRARWRARRIYPGRFRLSRTDLEASGLCMAGQEASAEPSPSRRSIRRIRPAPPPDWIPLRHDLPRHRRDHARALHRRHRPRRDRRRRPRDHLLRGDRRRPHRRGVAEPAGEAQRPDHGDAPRPRRRRRDPAPRPRPARRSSPARATPSARA